jgi:hypothetical protein
MKIPPQSAARMVDGARQHNHQARAERNAGKELNWRDQDRGSGCAVALIPLSFALYLVCWAIVRFAF